MTRTAAPWRRIFTDPAFLVERCLSRALEPLLDAAVRDGQTWLDVGCGQRPYEALFSGARYIGIDVPESGRPASAKRPDVVYDGARLPFEGGSVDGILCTEVLEHVATPEAFLIELARVLKPDGTLVLTVPFFWEQHEKPYDYYRFTEFGLRELLRKAGFEIAALKKSSSGVETLAQGLSIVLSSGPIARLPFGRTVFLATVCAPIQFLGLALAKAVPESGDLFLNLVVTALKKS